MSKWAAINKYELVDNFKLTRHEQVGSSIRYRAFLIIDLRL